MPPENTRKIQKRLITWRRSSKDFYKRNPEPAKKRSKNAYKNGLVCLTEKSELTDSTKNLNSDQPEKSKALNDEKRKIDSEKKRNYRCNLKLKWTEEEIKTKNLKVQTECEEDIHPIIGKCALFPILPRHMKPRCENCGKVVSKRSLLRHISHRQNCKNFYGPRFQQLRDEKRGETLKKSSKRFYKNKS